MECSRCENKVEKFKHLKKIKGEFLCKDCYRDNRLKFRKDTLENSEDKEIIKKLTRELKNKSQRKYRKKFTKEPPKIKGEKLKKQKNYCYLTLQDKQTLLRILMSKGLDFEDAKERVKEIINEQRSISKKMIKEGKSETEIKIEQDKMIEELWNY